MRVVLLRKRLDLLRLDCPLCLARLYQIEFRPHKADVAAMVRLLQHLPNPLGLSSTD